MARVQVRDRSIWTKHIHGDPALAQRLEALEPGATIELRVAGEVGLWEKMRCGPSGLNTPGLKPLGKARARWAEMFDARRGDLVELAIESEGNGEGGGSAPASLEAASVAERDAAWAAFKVLTRAGWRSEGEPSNRDELHDR